MPLKSLYLVVFATAVLLAVYLLLRPAAVSPPEVGTAPTSTFAVPPGIGMPIAGTDNGLQAPATEPPVRAVLDISVHTLEGLQVLFDRAEQLATGPQAANENASVVLILHGPEVEFFSIRNYDRYRDIVDQAARLDAFDIVDVKICQTMLGVAGVDRADIPAFIEQVPLGSAEVNRLVEEGYVTF